MVLEMLGYKNDSMEDKKQTSGEVSYRRERHKSRERTNNLIGCVTLEEHWNSFQSFISKDLIQGFLFSEGSVLDLSETS